MKLDRLAVAVSMARSCMTAKTIAETAKMPVPTVYNALYGRSVRPVTAGKIARALGVEVTDILEEAKP